MTKLTVIVPSGHPLRGRLFFLYPDSGATSYVEGQVTFFSPETPEERELRETLEALRNTLNRVRT